MRCRRTFAIGLGSAALLLGLLGAGASGTPVPSIRVTMPMPGIIHVGDAVTVSGRVLGAPRHSRAELQLEPQNGAFSTVASAALTRHGHFALRWRVTGSGYGFDRWRVVATNAGHQIAATGANQVVIGPANTPCDRPPPPAGKLPTGDGWLVGGLYGEGGPVGAPTRCSSAGYTITVTDAHGHVAAKQTVPALHSYRFTLPAGSYMLSDGGGCTGDGAIRVPAGKQITANTYCRYP